MRQLRIYLVIARRTEMKNDNVSVNGRQEEVIKKDNKKAKKSFTVIMFICLIVGAILGFLTTLAGRELLIITKVFQEFMENNAGVLSIILGGIMIGITVAASIWCVWEIGRNKKKAVELIEKDDDIELEKIEKRLSYGLWITNGLMILQFLYFSVMIFVFMNFLAIYEIVGLLVGTAIIFLVGILVLMLLQQKQIDCIRFLNPEKKGSIYDMNFHKKWEESCDEAELFVIYRAAYKAYRAANILYIILWAFFMLMGMAVGIGFLPILTIIILWATSTMVYSYHCMK